MAAIVVAVVLWWILKPHGPLPPYLVFDNRELGAHFEYPSEMRRGPNFVKASSGGILTIERYTLDQAKKDWLAELPDVLFPQVMIQINENYTDVTEVSRQHVTVDGRKGLEVVLKGRSGSGKIDTIITITIFADEKWVYVLRSYSPESLDAQERSLFRRVRETWKFLPEPSAQ